ncbi:CBM35 domain-containing protein [Streptomyces resistomycificus]|uniref:Carbohydrate-binding protein n=1 Tax=Streptomyces resistomycificus TaxID=67356 RepID=A0A0L8L6X4_9ACTN|nr:CBM35 domain-containing protein [Streptomyces resistomycificus]KOG33963.1 carbohydrate-binding protein [Streptomyces resistomycificus]KUN96467.1 carbohydrate-binding protein [Streptomyces resistomycificus]
MTAGNNGASTPEDDDPFGYLYEDGQANGAQPPSGGGGYGYPGSVNRVRAVGQRQYGQQAPAAATAPYGQVPQQQGAAPYGQTNAHYAAPETFPGGPPTSRQQSYGGDGGRRGPNTKGLLIGAIAVVAAVVIGIGVAMMGGDDDKGADDSEAATTPTTSQSAEPSPSNSNSEASQDNLPTIDAKALALGGTAATASDVKGAKADGGVYVTGFNQVGASVTWTVNGIPKSGKYTVYVGYSVPGKDQNATLTVNGTASTTPVDLKNWTGAKEGDFEKGWTKTYNYVQLNKGTNTIKVSCEQGNQCDALLDQMWLVKGWVKS